MNKPLQSFTQWIWQYENWTDFVWDEVRLQPKLRECWKLLGQLLGFTQNLNVVDYQQSSLNMLLNNIISSSAIEGEQLNRQSVRSSLAKRSAPFRRCTGCWFMSSIIHHASSSGVSWMTMGPGSGTRTRRKGRPSWSVAALRIALLAECTPAS